MSLHVISIGNMRFTSDSFTTKLNAKTKTAAVEGTKADVDKVPDYVLKMDNLPEDILNYPFLRQGRLFTLLGYKPANRKYPYIVKQMSTGKEFKVTGYWFHDIEIKKLIRTK